MELLPESLPQEFNDDFFEKENDNYILDFIITNHEKYKNDKVYKKALTNNIMVVTKYIVKYFEIPDSININKINEIINIKCIELEWLILSNKKYNKLKYILKKDYNDSNISLNQFIHLETIIYNINYNKHYKLHYEIIGDNYIDFFTNVDDIFNLIKPMYCNFDFFDNIYGPGTETKYINMYIDELTNIKEINNYNEIPFFHCFKKYNKLYDNQKIVEILFNIMGINKISKIVLEIYDILSYENKLRYINNFINDFDKFNIDNFKINDIIILFWTNIHKLDNVKTFEPYLDYIIKDMHVNMKIVDDTAYVQYISIYINDKFISTCEQLLEYSDINKKIIILNISYINFEIFKIVKNIKPIYSLFNHYYNTNHFDSVCILIKRIHIINDIGLYINLLSYIICNKHLNAIKANELITSTINPYNIYDIFNYLVKKKGEFIFFEIFCKTNIKIDYKQIIFDLNLIEFIKFFSERYYSEYIIDLLFITFIDYMDNKSKDDINISLKINEMHLFIKFLEKENNYKMKNDISNDMYNTTIKYNIYKFADIFNKCIIIDFSNIKINLENSVCYYIIWNVFIDNDKNVNFVCNEIDKKELFLEKLFKSNRYDMIIKILLEKKCDLKKVINFYDIYKRSDIIKNILIDKYCLIRCMDKQIIYLNDMKCCICLDNNSDVMTCMLPCGHVTYCYTCWIAVDEKYKNKCMLCNKIVNDFLFIK